MWDGAIFILGVARSCSFSLDLSMKKVDQKISTRRECETDSARAHYYSIVKVQAEVSNPQIAP